MPNNKYAMNLQPFWQQLPPNKTGGGTAYFDPKGLSDPAIGTKLIKGDDGIVRMQSFVSVTKLGNGKYDATPIIGNSKRDEGCEVKYKTATAKIKRRYYGFKIRFVDYKPDKSSFLICQWKLGPYYPQLAIWVTVNAAGKQEFAVVKQFNSKIVNADKPEAKGITKFLGVLVESNKDYEFAFDIDFQPNKSGAIAVYINKKLAAPEIGKKVTLTGQNMDLPADPNNMDYQALRWGCYCWQMMNFTKGLSMPTVLTRIALYWDVFVGGQDFTFADLGVNS